MNNACFYMERCVGGVCLYVCHNNSVSQERCRCVPTETICAVRALMVLSMHAWFLVLCVGVCSVALADCDCEEQRGCKCVAFVCFSSVCTV